MPTAKPVMDVVGESEFVIVPLPDNKVHDPIPTVAEFATMVVVGDEIQSVCEDPAIAVVGTSFTSMETVEEEGAQGAFAIVHAKTFVPNPKPVIDVVGESEFVIVPLPETKVHTPAPAVAELADIIALGEEIQIV